MDTDKIAMLTSLLRQGWDQKVIFDLDLESGEVFEESLEESLAPYRLNMGWDTLIIQLRAHLGYSAPAS